MRMVLASEGILKLRNLNLYRRICKYLIFFQFNLLEILISKYLLNMSAIVVRV